ncbi:MAG: DNA polymerase III subunit gamma/tau [Acidimicrobiia bacterium]|nr:DNA polymerase III subunit gamma/tau [Acidimicrobiia bacterium]
MKASVIQLEAGVPSLPSTTVRRSMEYLALYRKYRPATFEDVVGQSHVTSTLAREVAEGRVAHAYLFTGPRGTGKTTTARILAKALNCANLGADGSPDATCDSCVAIAEGSSFDVMELDAASHNSVDDIRDLRNRVSTMASAEGSRRVYILDEAHMLSNAAGNALLKTLEEPPEMVHFVLATTEPYKLLDTIRSRAQRFDFHPVPTDKVAAHLSRIAELEGYKTDTAALLRIARHATGSVRDSLSLLEQVAALGEGSVTPQGVRRALGLAGLDAMTRLAGAIAARDAKSGLELVAELTADGVDLRRFIAEAVGFFRGVFLSHYAPNVAEIADEPEEVIEAWRAASVEMAPTDVLRAVDLLGEALIRLREGREERLMAEMAMIKLARPEFSTDAEALTSRLDRLERKVATGAPRESHTPKHQATSSQVKPDESAPAESGAPSKKPPPTPEPTTKTASDETVGEIEDDTTTADVSEDSEDAGDKPETSPLPGSEPLIPTEPPPERATAQFSLNELKAVWPGLYGSLRDLLGARRWALFREAVPTAVEHGAIIFQVPYDFHREQLTNDPAVASIVATNAGDLLGGAVEVRFQVAPTAVSTDDDESDDEENLIEDSGSEPPDPTTLLQQELGATVIEETEGE